MCCPAGKWHRRMMALLKSVAAFVLLLSWVAQYADLEHRRYVDLEHNFKWYTSEEASQEVRGFHHYVAALASHDMPLDKPVFLDAALGLGLGPDTLNVSQMPLTGLADLRAFFWSVHAEDAHRLVRREPAHWSSLADLVVSGSTVGSRRQGEPFLSGGLLGGGWLGGAPKRAQEPAAGGALRVIDLASRPNLDIVEMTGCSIARLACRNCSQRNMQRSVPVGKPSARGVANPRTSSEACANHVAPCVSVHNAEK